MKIMLSNPLNHVVVVLLSKFSVRSDISNEKENGKPIFQFVNSLTVEMIKLVIMNLKLK